VCAAVLVPLSLGWSMNTLVASIAFMVASTPTRGGVSQSLVAVFAALVVGWILAHASIVLLGDVLGRMPLALLLPFAIAAAFAYASALRPPLAILRTVAGLVALLPIFGGAAAPTDVYGTYSTGCYIGAALVVGWSATRLLWPATAARLFRERIAAQLELCLNALRGREPGADGTPRPLDAAAMVGAYAGQLAQLGPLHAQARYERVEHALDEARRGELLTRAQDLFDAVLGARGAAPWRVISIAPDGEHPLAPLREALLRADAALLASIRAAAEVIRGTGEQPGGALSEAHDAVLAHLRDIGSRPDAERVARSAFGEDFLRQLDARRQLVARQLAVEACISEWQRAARASAT